MSEAAATGTDPQALPEKRNGAARLDHQLQRPQRKSHCLANFIVADNESLAQQFAIDLERHLAGRDGLQGITNTPRAFVICDAFAGPQRARGIVEIAWLHAMHGTRWRQRLDCQRAARGQTAAAAADQDLVRHVRGTLLHDFKADRALTGNDIGVVVRGHQPGAAFGGEVARYLLAVSAITIVQNRFAAELARIFDFGLRRILRHHDCRLYAEQLTGGSNALGMIAR
jgi:hypothetical protein